MQVAFVFLNFNGEGYAVNPFGGDNKVYTAKAKALATTMATAWVNFVNHLDPNGKKGLGLPGGSTWPKYDTGAGGGVGQNVIWDLAGGALLAVDEQTRPLFAEYVKDVSFSADGRSLFTSGEDSFIRMWDLATGVETARFAGGVAGAPAFAVLAGRGAVAGIDGRGVLRVWSAPWRGPDVFSFACDAMPKEAPAPQEDRSGVCGDDYAPPSPWWTTPGRTAPAPPEAR